MPSEVKLSKAALLYCNVQYTFFLLEKAKQRRNAVEQQHNVHVLIGCCGVVYVMYWLQTIKDKKKRKQSTTTVKREKNTPLSRSNVHTK
jgi:hypothetical protein